jgi:hypothetical protein
MIDLFFLAFVGLVSYEVYQMYQLIDFASGEHDHPENVAQSAFADTDYTNEMLIQNGEFTDVQRDGVAYIYTLQSGIRYKSYYPYEQAVEPKLKLPEPQATF